MIAGNRSTLANSDDTVTVEQTANIIAVEDNTDTPRQDESMSYQILSDLANENHGVCVIDRGNEEGIRDPLRAGE